MKYVEDRYGFEAAVCPDCGQPCEAEHVDIGVGNQRVERWHCRCGWEEPDTGGDLMFDFEESIA